MRLLLTGLLIITLCSGNLSANGPMIGNRPKAAQITAAPERILEKTIPLINGTARLSISVTIGPSYCFEITEVTTSTSTTPTTTTGATTTGATATGATTTGAATPSTTAKGKTTTGAATPSTTANGKTTTGAATPSTTANGKTTTGAAITSTTANGKTTTGAATPSTTANGTTATGTTTTGKGQGHGRKKIVRADTNPLNGGDRLALITYVKPGSSYSFDTTNVKYSKANEQIHLNVTMCNGNEADAVTVNRSNTDTYEVSAETIERMIKTFNCSVKSRVKRNNENGNYSMTLIIYVDKNNTSMNIAIVGYYIYPSATTTSPSPTPTLTHASTAASTTPPAAASTTLPAAASTTPPTEASGVSETVVNSTKELKYGTPVEISVDVHPGSSYSFNITNEEDHKPTGEIQVKVTMCNASKEAAKPVESSGNGLYEIPATKLHDLIIYFNCSHKSRVKRSTGSREYKMNLFITGTSKTNAPKNISVVGISTDTDFRGTTPTHTTATQSGSTSSSTTHATTAHTTPATSLSTGWIIGIVFIALFGVTLIVAISVFAYFYLKKRRGSINDDREGLFKRQQFVDEVPPRILPLPKTFGDYQTPQTSSMIPAINNYSSSRPSYYPQTSSTNPPTNNQFGSQLSNYTQPSSNYPKLIRPNIQSLQPNIASSINPATPNNNLYGPRGLSRNY